MKINFFSEDIPFKLHHPRNVRQWIELVVQSEGYVVKDLNYVFCSDPYLHNINLQYLQHNTYTDIITFDRSEAPKTISADIFISIDRVEENARTFAATFAQELHRVMIHGILHLCGYADKSKEEKQAMRKKEEACLSLLKN